MSNRPARRTLRAALRRMGLATENALELARLGRLTAPQHAPYRVFSQNRIARLRRYGDDHYMPLLDAPLLLIPPLMVTSEIYDVAPDISAVSALLAAGLDVWLIDFGSPEQEEGGLERTLDDHLLAIDDAIEQVTRATGHDVHLVGYSQGGMFAYQVASYRRTEGIASLITFGSPVDIHRNLPNINDQLAGRVFDAARTVLETPLEKLEGLPGFLTSTGFKLLSVRKEISQLFDFVQKLHDRKALEKREARRRFLAGEGFVAWPGPALRKFIDEFVVHNRMSSGGFVVAGRPVSLADIRCPVLCFVGGRDTIAQPASVRAIHQAAPNAEVHEVELRAGHFGLVVGRQALDKTWPTVVAWARWQQGVGPRPPLLVAAPPLQEPEEADFDAVDFDFGLFYDTVARSLAGLWDRLGDASEDLGDRMDTLRWQVPRLGVLRQLRPDTRISIAQVLSEQARENPDGTFFLWGGRAFSYRDADRRVDNVARGLVQLGIRPGDHVAVLMDPRPSYLSMTTALNRLGAVPILLSPARDKKTLAHFIKALKPVAVVADPEHAKLARQHHKGKVFVLGGVNAPRELPKGVVDMEQIQPETVELPDWYDANPGLSRDVAMIMLTAGRGAEPRAARITNRRWAVSAYGTAAACTLSPKDTVYCCLPLHHPAGMLVAVGGALVGGSRLALSGEFEPARFWGEVRRYGASVVFYAGEMLRALLDEPPSAADNKNPLRLVAGSGLRTDVWREFVERFGPVGVLEFYASTEGNAVLANASGEKIGSLGRKLPGSSPVALARYDFDRGTFVEDEHGFLQPALVDEPGILLAHIDGRNPLIDVADTTPSAATDADAVGSRIRRDAFEAGDAYFITWDVLQQDADGDFWFVDRVQRMLKTPSGPISTRQIEDRLYESRLLRRCVVFGVPYKRARVPMAVVVPRGTFQIEALERFVNENMPPHERPHWIRVVDQIPLTDGFRPMKAAWIALGTQVTGKDRVWAYDPKASAYKRLRAKSPTKKRASTRR